MLTSILWIILAAGLYGLIHSLLATPWVKAQVCARFGPQAVRWYRLGYNLFALVSLLPVLGLAAALPDRPLYRIPAPWLYLALAGQLLALAALAIGLWQTGAWSFLGLEPLLSRAPEASPRLVVDGLYRWVRHPLYTAGLALIWLTPVMSANLLALYLGLSAYLVIGAKYEERKLRREFGEAYARYQARTPMLVPFARFRSG